jgi:hypothetical protein
MKHSSLAKVHHTLQGETQLFRAHPLPANQRLAFPPPLNGGGRPA